MRAVLQWSLIPSTLRVVAPEHDDARCSGWHRRLWRYRSLRGRSCPPETRMAMFLGKRAARSRRRTLYVLDGRPIPLTRHLIQSTVHHSLGTAFPCPGLAEGWDMVIVSQAPRVTTLGLPGTTYVPGRQAVLDSVPANGPDLNAAPVSLIHIDVTGRVQSNASPENTISITKGSDVTMVLGLAAKDTGYDRWLREIFTSSLTIRGIPSNRPPCRSTRSATSQYTQS